MNYGGQACSPESSGCSIFLLTLLPLHLHFVLLLALNPGLKRCINYITVTTFFFFCFAVSASAQYIVRGTVFDSSRNATIESVTVLSTGGRGTVTDSMGRYKIEVSEKDSILFSFLGKMTPKYPVLKIADVSQFDIALRLKMDVMKEVKIRTRIYRQDSIQNRKDYAKGFNFRRPNIASLTSVTNSGVGIDIQELIRVFQFRKNRSMERFRERLLEQEKEKFVDYRFNKALVRRLTNLDGGLLEKFMQQHRPSYLFALYASEYDFQYYVKKSGEDFTKQKSF